MSINRTLEYYRNFSAAVLCMFAVFLAATALLHWPLSRSHAVLGAVWIGISVLSIALASKRLVALAAAAGAIAARALIGFLLMPSVIVGVLGVGAAAAFLWCCYRDLKNRYDAQFLRALSDRSLSATAVDVVLLAAILVAVSLLQQFLMRVLGLTSI